MMNRPLGCKRDPKRPGDPKCADYAFADYHSDFVRRIGLKTAEDTRLVQFARIRQQIGESCVGEWAAQAQGIRDRSQGVNITYSGLAAYRLARTQEATDTLGKPPPLDYFYFDDGTYMRSMARAATRWGFVEEGSLAQGKWPHEARLLLKTPSRRALDGARKARGFLYLRIDGDTEARRQQIETAIRASYPVGASIAVDQAILDWQGSTPIGPPRGSVIGLHAITLCAIRKDGAFGAPSTWGEDYADHGIMWLDASALSEDCWCLADAIAHR